MRSALARAAACAMAWAFAACRAPDPPAAATAPPPTSPTPSSSTAPTASAQNAPRTPAPDAAKEDDDDAPHHHAGAIDAEAPAAPCDFDRPYRGTIGEASVSWLLETKGGEVRGHAAYDRGAGRIELHGVVEPDGGLRLTERIEGRDVSAVRVHCDRDTGALLGSFLQRGSPETVRMTPRGKGAAALIERRKKIGELVDGEPSCTWDVRSPAVFGLGDPQREARINAALRVRFPDEAALEKRIAPCPPDGDNHVTGWYSVEMNERGVLGVLHDGYLYFGPAVHGQWNAAADTLNIDVPTGRRLGLRDVVVSADALRPLVASCVPFAGEKLGWSDYELERNLQGTPAEEGEPSTIHEPSFLVLPDGIAVVLRGLPTVAAWSELSGPVIEWGALVREGVLAPRSPIARLWSKEPAHAPGVPACRRIFTPKWAPAR